MGFAKFASSVNGDGGVIANGSIPTGPQWANYTWQRTAHVPFNVYQGTYTAPPPTQQTALSSQASQATNAPKEAVTTGNKKGGGGQPDLATPGLVPSPPSGTLLGG